MICLVDPKKDEEFRPCFPGGERYAAPFEKIYESSCISKDVLQPQQSPGMIGPIPVYYSMDLNLKQSYVVYSGQGQHFDSIGKLHPERFEKKRRYLEQFFKRTDLIYPGQ